MDQRARMHVAIRSASCAGKLDAYRKAQTERVLENIQIILDDQKLSFTNVVKSTVFLTDLANFAGMNEIYAKYFTNDFPARSTIQVAALPKGASVEIEVIAHF